MKNTKSNRNQLSPELNPYEQLEPRHRTAVRMRLDFYKYRHIAKKMKVEEQTVKGWFMHNGICKAAYDFMLSERAKEDEELSSKIRERIKSMTPEAIIVIQNALSKNDTDTAWKILGVEGIAPVQKHEVDTGNREKVDAISGIIDEFQKDVKPKKRNKPRKKITKTI